jgi:hypothetical protein
VPVVGGYQGFNFLGLLFPLLLLFLLFGIIRSAFSHGRGWDHHGYRHGYGWDRGWDRDDSREGGATSWREQRERRMAELHRRLHESDGADPGSAGSGATGSAPTR